MEKTWFYGNIMKHRGNPLPAPRTAACEGGLEWCRLLAFVKPLVCSESWVPHFRWYLDVGSTPQHEENLRVPPKDRLSLLFINFFFFKLRVYLFIYGCVGSSFLRKGFL